MSKRDFYDVLGASRQASADELKKAYRVMAMKHHPDRNAGDKKSEEKLKEINEAYEILKDPQKKAAYDRMGHAAFDASNGQGFGGGRGNQSSSSGFSSIFEEMFGDFMGGERGSTGQSQVQRGSDIRFDLALSLEQAFEGLQKDISLRTYVLCDPCGGAGSNHGSNSKTCNQCQGRGVVRAQQGFFTIERTCVGCQGKGTVIKDPCKSCHGQGRVIKSRTLKVSIPAGVEDGSRVRLSGEGEAGPNNGTNGDLYIFISLLKHAMFTRNHADLHFEVTIPMTVAALGGDIDVPTIEGGKARVAIPAGTQSNKQFRLKGKGMSILRQRDRGDLFVHVQVETPTNLSSRQKELLEEFNKAGQNSNNNPQASKFKDIFRSVWHKINNIKDNYVQFTNYLFQHCAIRKQLS